MYAILVAIYILSRLAMPTVTMGYSKFKGAGDVEGGIYIRPPVLSRAQQFKRLMENMNEHIKHHGAGDVDIIENKHRTPMAYRSRYTEEALAGDLNSIRLFYRRPIQRWAEEIVMNGPDQNENVEFPRLNVHSGSKYHHDHGFGND